MGIPSRGPFPDFAGNFVSSFFGTDRAQSLELAAAIGALLPDLEKAVRVIERENGKTRLSKRLREHEERLKAAIVGEALK